MLEPTTQRLLTVAEAAKILGVTKGRVCQWLWSNAIQGVRVGWMWLIPEKELAKFKIPPKVGRPRSGKK